MTLIVVDIGNTRIKWGRCSAEGIDVLASLPSDDPAAWAAQAAAWNLRGERWVVASVQPRTRESLVGWLNEQKRPVDVIGMAKQIPIVADVDNPDYVGVDRLLDAVAANVRRAANKRAIIIDAGSAVTVDLVDAAGAFRGGAIFPGLRLMAEALHDHTAQLPVVAIHERIPPPARSTIAAIETGVLHAVLGGIDRLVAEMLDPDTTVYLTGGDAPLLAPHLRSPVTVWPEMTLEGIRLTAVGAAPGR